MLVFGLITRVHQQFLWFNNEVCHTLKEWVQIPRMYSVSGPVVKKLSRDSFKIESLERYQTGLLFPRQAVRKKPGYIYCSPDALIEGYRENITFRF